MDFNCYRFDPNVISEDRPIKGLSDDSRNELIGGGLWARSSDFRLMSEDDEYIRLLDEKNSRIRQNRMAKRVFISHRQTDKAKALWLRQCFVKRKIDTWLDVIDLKIISNHMGSLQPIAIANIIELALLNCTHVIALMTPKSAGSAWIPYEFGRVKDKKLNASNAAVFVHNLKKGDLPEYMQIIKDHLWKEKDIDKWI